MRLSALATILLVFIAAAGASLFAANYSVGLIEDNSEISVRRALDAREMDWAEVQADGLKVNLSGIAPTEALRFAAISEAGTIVDAARVIDEMQVAAAAALAPPKFSAEILRNGAGLSIIGLLPAELDRATVIERLQEIVGSAPVTDLVETAEFDPPEGLATALAFATSALEDLQRAKVSVSANSVSIVANTDSDEEKRKLEARLNRAAPSNLELSLEISAPRPVITPFTLRFVRTENGAHFDACSADTALSHKRIMEAAQAAGMRRPSLCQIGLGVPSPKWGTAVTQTIEALSEIGAGTVTFSDADIVLVAAEGSDQARFDDVIGRLENSLPEVFALQARLPVTLAEDQSPKEFVATRSPEGLVQLRGRLTDENMRNVVTSFAQAAFGAQNVHSAARVVEGMPRDWALRVLTGLEGLSQLSNGAMTVTPDTLTISGATGDPEASTRIASLFAEKLGESTDFDIKVAYEEKLDPVASQPTPEECEAELAEIGAANKIRFEPGSATIDASALGTIDDIASILKQCGQIRLEIQGHTDSQGREIMNLELSQARATSVLNELRARRVLTSTYSAKGYGETQPIADNKTEEGREANRRIEFRLIRPKASIPQGDSALESLAKPEGEDPIDEPAETDGNSTSE